MARLSAEVIGVVSDTHIGSRYESPEELQAVYDEFTFRGVTTVLHAGDVLAGSGMYRDNVTDELSPVAQVDRAEDVYPRAPGVRTFMIAGNHDLHGDSRHGNPVRELARRRRDLIYMGSSRATLTMPDGTRVLLAHGSGPAAYAHSHKAQRFIEQLPTDERPEILVLGHFHKAAFFRHDGVTCLMAGCFQRQTPFMRGRGITPDIGGWIVTIRAAHDGTRTVSAEWIGRPREIARAA